MTILGVRYLRGVSQLLDPAIKQYADSLYQKALLESAQTARQDTTKYLQERSRTSDSRQLFSGIDYQGLVRIYVNHIERCTAARLDSYQKAFNEISRQPTEAELNEAFEDFKLTWEVQIKHSTQALSNFGTARNAPTKLDPSSDLRAGSAHGHDRVLQDWKIWRGRVALRISAPGYNASSEYRSQAMQPAPQTQRPDDTDRINTAFISYSWDDDVHATWVRELAKRLRSDGVDVSLDRWVAVPGDQLPAFMERAIRENQFVVIICTPRYKRRADAREGGVGYEGDIMTAEVMTSQNHRKFIPVLRSGTYPEAAPSWLLGKYHINLTGEPYSERYYEDLVRTLLGIREIAPPIGKPLATITGKMNPQPNSKLEADVQKFSDIKIVRVIVEDISEPLKNGTPGSALYSIPFLLSNEPPPEWAELFPENWDHPARFSSMHRPGIASVDGSTVILEGTTIEEVERYHRDTLQLAVGETNRQYRERLMTQENHSARENAAREEHRRRIEEASKRIKFD